LREAFTAKPVAASEGFGLGAMDYGDGEATMVATNRPAPAPPVPKPAPPPPPEPVKKSPPFALIGGGVAAVLVVLGGAGYFLFGSHAAPKPTQTATITQPQMQPVSQPAAPPAMTKAEREAGLISTLGSLPCTLLSVDDSGAAPVISGLAGAGAPQAGLSGALQSLPSAATLTNNTQTIDGPYCDALNAIRPYHLLFGDAAGTLTLGLAGGKTTLHDGELITVAQKMPGYTGYLETDYFSNDGTVLHLYPTPTDAQKMLEAGGAKVLGDPAHGGADWQVSAPYGTDMIIAIASTTPLFATARPQDENASDYLPALRAALQNAASSGAKLSVAALPVVTEPK
jgi:eukaryotic-like serine/threonine-protein kinase